MTDDEKLRPCRPPTLSSNGIRPSPPSLRSTARDLFDVRVFQNAKTTAEFYQFIATFRQEFCDKVKESSATHKFIPTLRDGGRLMRCYTQNIDGLEARENLCTDLKAGSGNRRRFMKRNFEGPRPEITKGTDFDPGCEVVQLHGELGTLRCRLCNTEYDWTDSATGKFLGGTAPACSGCEERSNQRKAAGKRGLAVGELRPNIVLYGEDHPHDDLLTSLIKFDLASGPDLLVIIGTSLKVHGLQEMVRNFATVVHNQKHGRVVFVNRTPPPKSQWDGVIDDHIEMDCDTWVLGLQTRRQDLRLMQDEIRLMTTKTASRKRSTPAETSGEESLRRPKRKAEGGGRYPLSGNILDKTLPRGSWSIEG